MKKIISVFLCLILALSMAACGNAENNNSAGGTQTKADTSAGNGLTNDADKNGTAQSGDGADEGGAAKDSDAGNDGAGDGTKTTNSGNTADGSDTGNNEDEDMAEINMVYFSMASIPTGLSDVEAEINAITENEINTHVNIEMIELGSYEQQINLKISSGEKLDLMVTIPYGAPTFSNMASQKQLMDISELLTEYGKGVVETVGDFIDATTVGDAIYGVTTYRTLNSNVYIVMRTDVLEDLGLTDKTLNMASFAEYEEILKAVKDSDKWSYLAGIVPSDSSGLILPIAGAYMDTDKFAEASSYDSLGDLNKIIAINPDGSNPTVALNFASDKYKAMTDMLRSWYESGYIYKDAANQSETAEALVKSNAAFSFICSSEVGVETAKSEACGMDMTCVKVLSLPITTSSCTKFVWTVPQTATEPEAAVKMMNLMYTDARICNLLTWGVEGKDYVEKDGVAVYPDGVENAAYHTADFIYGNQFLALPWAGQSSDFRETSKADMDAAPTSAYLGFSCDTSNIENELTAITNTINEFLPGLDSGVAEDGQYDAFLEKLEKSGVQKVVDTYQEQLNSWLESK